METVTIENVPKSFIKKYGKVLSYNKFEENFYKKNENITYWNDEEINNMGKTSTILSNSF
ncbi:MAG: hypothetical protein Q9M94_02970 [Candidatus Gracilibacteria bacterium]|nr:hypothetical protein [Candidatus Gracilibacteria bacterium]MDQ7022701.1 hypothetical protein [Candidatus Gracilibacteria bacterium]